jgi:hypothetical protein
MAKNKKLQTTKIYPDVLHKARVFVKETDTILYKFISKAVEEKIFRDSVKLDKKIV